MTIFVDNNISYRIARALDNLSSGLTRKETASITVEALRDSAFRHDAADETWIPAVAKNQDWILTQDVNIRQLEQQFSLLQRHGTNVIFLRSSDATNGYWRMVSRIIDAWPEVLKHIIAQQNSSHNAVEIGLKNEVSHNSYGKPKES